MRGPMEQLPLCWVALGARGLVPCGTGFELSLGSDGVGKGAARLIASSGAVAKGW